MEPTFNFSVWIDGAKVGNITAHTIHEAKDKATIKFNAPRERLTVYKL
jgi:hypothetical protein